VVIPRPLQELENREAEELKCRPLLQPANPRVV
jgi:hypothetical protein